MGAVLRSQANVASWTVSLADRKFHHLVIGGFAFAAGAFAFSILRKAFMPDNDEVYDAENLVKGTIREREFTDDWEVAQRRAKGHLRRMPTYYTERIAENETIDDEE